MPLPNLLTDSICTIPDPVLLSPARQLNTLELANLGRLRDFADHLLAVMEEANGVGLAAPQVGQPLAVAVLRWQGFEAAWANPRVVSTGPRRVTDMEGCLSIPLASYTVERFQSVVVEAFDLRAGGPTTVELDGWAARVAQHEIDHLRGALICAPDTPGHLPYTRR